MGGDCKVDRTLDITGETCPLTFVRSKLAIERMAVGEVLEILTDHPPAAQSLPQSLTQQGQQVLKVEQTGATGWRLLVRKSPAKPGA